MGNQAIWILSGATGRRRRGKESLTSVLALVELAIRSLREHEAVSGLVDHALIGELEDGR